VGEMNISYLELPTKDLIAQRDFYSQVLALPVHLSAERLGVRAGETDLVFTQADPDFDGAYHFAFNIPENQSHAAKAWILERIPLLHDENGQDEFTSESWNSQSVYFKDAAGNVLEFIARHNLKNGGEAEFDSARILNVSELGLPSEDVIAFARDLCSTLGISPFKQEPNETFTPVGDDHGLFILPIKNRIWIPNSGVAAKLLPVRVKVNVNGKSWEVRGVPYEIVGG
jgi:catechol-2,3-dioxygenase